MTHPTVRIRAALLAVALVGAGAVAITAGTTDSEAAVDYESYIAKAAEAAKASKKKYGVPRAVTIAQSMLESGWGLSGLSTKYKNYFGIKCGATRSPYQKGCVSLASYEYVKGKKKKKYVSRFRVYSSMEKSFLDHGRLLNYADRYNAAFKYPNNPNKFIKAVHKAGYATDPKYSTLVINLMKKWNLYRFDAPAKKTKKDPNPALISKLAPAAQRGEAATGVPSSVLIAQALYHSKSGTSTVAKKAKNYFGLRCGRTSKACVKINGVRYRKYSTAAKSIADQAKVLSSGRYKKAAKVNTKPKAFLTAIHKAGWSPNKAYVSKVYPLITKYGLTQYDLLIATTLKPGTRGAKVTALQHLLINAGRKVKATGYYGTDTRTAVKAYQKKRGLPVTGKADPLTLKRLTPDVRKGAKGAEVTSLHTLLKSRGHKVNAGSTFGTKTLKAVKSLQKKSKLPQTGTVSVKTWGKLFG